MIGGHEALASGSNRIGGISRSALLSKEISSITMATAQELTPEQFKTILGELTKDLIPADPPTQTVLQRLAPHRQTLIAYRKQGFTIPQLAALVKNPRIGIPASAATIRRVISGEAKKKVRAPGEAKVTVLPAKAATPA
jgi:hypothetical protein